MNNNYYQSDIKTSRQEDSIYAMRYASQQMLIDKLQQKLEAYENMRKEEIELINTLDFDKFVYSKTALKGFKRNSLNILNKVGDSNE